MRLSILNIHAALTGIIEHATFPFSPPSTIIIIDNNRRTELSRSWSALWKRYSVIASGGKLLGKLLGKLVFALCYVTVGIVDRVDAS